MPFAVAGWVAVAAGAVLAAIGAYFLAQHSDRRAGVVRRPVEPSLSGANDGPGAAGADEEIPIRLR
jgi:hypothetical protein